MKVIIKEVMASRLGIEPAHIRSYELDGLVYLTWADSLVVGAQCRICYSIIWVDQRVNPVLSEPKPNVVPDYGGGYYEYQKEKVHRFLASMPACPKCGGEDFDRFINNVNYQRFQSGKEFPKGVVSSDLIKEDASAVLVYFVE
ncbi:hypothetical protein ACFFU8_21185 [Chromobacterium piscinae]|uniref:hypothetical protein n=2 Tax=Chromobacterium piscinae TaxID=686831 RepID=UPI001C8C20EE|nr:hypothetical protein [Chromobacterium piscinae]MBX9346367.1 hypothetical protein [Chromobacterium vaccinii]MCD4503908.1 hypothetical protein [Chromobacterium piscinae]MCD5328922.1 hypothetical protein [Chromobacterium piscinae]